MEKVSEKSANSLRLELNERRLQELSASVRLAKKGVFGLLSAELLAVAMGAILMLDGMNQFHNALTADGMPIAYAVKSIIIISVAVTLFVIFWSGKKTREDRFDSIETRIELLSAGHDVSENNMSDHNNT
jgi:hypothetical protein